MDLVEWVKKGNVWKLESEAFKKPIEIKICYDNKELNSFLTTCEALDAKIAKHGERFLVMEEKDGDLQHWIHITQEAVTRNTENLSWCMHIVEEMNWELKELYKAIADAKNTIEIQNGTILKLQEQVKLLEKKVTKQPMVYHDKQFISWRESSGLWVYDIPDWEYLMLLNTKIWEHNEYVNNEDGFIVERIHVSGPYVPFYKLEWGTELDTPTATIYYDLVFIPI
jgi:hypothetical protein